MANIHAACILAAIVFTAKLDYCAAQENFGIEEEKFRWIEVGKLINKDLFCAGCFHVNVDNI